MQPCGTGYIRQVEVPVARQATETINGRTARYVNPLDIRYRGRQPTIILEGREYPVEYHLGRPIVFVVLPQPVMVIAQPPVIYQRREPDRQIPRPLDNPADRRGEAGINARTGQLEYRRK